MVALLAEGVDRNINAFQPITYRRPVALLAEGVDRNIFASKESFGPDMSPSSRRAWIEMSYLWP